MENEGVLDVKPTVKLHRVISLAEYQASFEELEEVEKGEEKELYLNEALKEVEEGPDDEALEEVKQCESILHTRCTMNGKVCSHH